MGITLLDFAGLIDNLLGCIAPDLAQAKE